MPLFEDDMGLLFEYIAGAADETEFLYEEIFTRRSYLRRGVCVPLTGAPVIMYVGANIGLFSLAALRENANARVYAFEPAPAAFECLERNLSAVRSAQPATCTRVLLRDSASTCPLHWYPEAPAESTCHPREREGQRLRLAAVAKASEAEADSSSAAAVPASAAEVIQVSAMTLAAFLEREALDSIDLLKVDVEGDELRVLMGVGAQNWHRIRQVVVEVHDINGRLDACVRLLRRHGFKVHSEACLGGTEQGYAMVVPSTLRLFYIYAVRAERKRKRSDHYVRECGSDG